MAESMPEEAKRPSAFETKSMTRKTLELCATSVCEFCDWSGLSADSNVEAFGCGQTSHRVLELAFFRGPLGLESRETVGKYPLLLSNILAAGVKSTGSKLPSPQRMEKRRFRVFRSLSPTRGNVTQTCEFLGTDNGWSPKLGDTFVPSGRYREKRNWRGGRYDQSPLKTMSMDGASIRKASATTAIRQASAQPELRKTPVAVPPSRREFAGGYGAISRTPLWSFGGQSRKPSNLGIHTKTRTMEISQVCAPLREKRTCQPKSVRARSMSPATLRALQQPSPLSTTSTAPSFVIDLFSANTDIQQFFLNRGVQCAKLDPFCLMTTQFFDYNSRDCAHPRKWSDPRRDALAASIFAHSWQKPSTCAKRDTTLGIASFDSFR